MNDASNLMGSRKSCSEDKKMERDYYFSKETLENSLTFYAVKIININRSRMGETATVN